MTSIRAVVYPLVVLVAAGASLRNVSVSRWTVELSAEGERDRDVRLMGTLEFPSVKSIRARRSSAAFTLGAGDLGPLPKPLVADHCVSLAGRAAVRRTRDSLEIDFSQSADCGLVAVGIVSSDTVRGMWFQPRFSGHAAKGPFAMWRHQ